MESVRVTYRLDASVSEAETRAEALAREQTVEVPREVVDRHPELRERVVGRVVAFASAAPDGVDVTLDFPVETTAGDPAQFLNVVFGMASLQPDVVCRDVVLPDSLASVLSGPRFGIAGLRERLGVPERPLTCTAVKPMGLDPKALALRMRDFARAGIDVVKDDQGLADHGFCPFEARVRACLDSVARVADETGREALYAPNLIGSPSATLAQLEIAQSLGARAVMVSPMLLGLPFFQELCRRHADVPVLAHPSFGGVQRFAPELLFGSLLRWFGADAVIFVGYDGRYSTPRESCRRLAERLRRPEGARRASLPVPGGGVELERVPELLEFYGRDVMLLVGGSLQIEPGKRFERSRAFVEAVHAAACPSVGPASR